MLPPKGYTDVLYPIFHILFIYFMNLLLIFLARLPANIESTTIKILLQLQECISILFTFKRYGILEVKFSEDLHTWLEVLVSL